MRNIFRNFSLATVAIVFAALIAVPALAQLNYAPVTTFLNGGTNNVVAAATNDYTGAAGNIITVTKQDRACFEVKWTNSASGVGTNLTFRFDRSLDHSDWVAWTNVNVLYGATGQTNIFDIDFGGAGYGRLNSVANTNNVLIATNLYLQWAVKTGLK